MDIQQNKPFRPKKSGKKEIMKKKKGPKKEKNLKAYTFNSIIRARKAQKRNADREHKKHHIPIANRTTEECTLPPIIVSVVGPREVGKTTLIKNLVKHYTRRTITETKGPISVVAGKKRRLTFFECSNDINAMIDMAKVSDLVLLLIDANFGFEMETFEFLHIAQTHGFPKIIGVLTHLDLIKTQKVVQKTKKEMKKRFWKEVYPGAKLFYLSQLKYGKYLNNEIRNLARFISVMKFRPLIWKNSHPFVLVDRFEDITDTAKKEKNPKGSRTVSFYGFVRGTSLKSSMTLHLLGVGDFSISSIKEAIDPIPLPNTEKRKIREAERGIYAPFANVGDIICDEDAVYIELNDQKIKFTETNEKVANKNLHGKKAQGLELIKSLQKMDHKIDEQLEVEGFKMIENKPLLTSETVDAYERKNNMTIPEALRAPKCSDILNSVVSRPVIAQDGSVKREIVFSKQYHESDKETTSEDSDYESNLKFIKSKNKKNFEKPHTVETRNSTISSHVDMQKVLSKIKQNCETPYDKIYDQTSTPNGSKSKSFESTKQTDFDIRNHHSKAEIDFNSKKLANRFLVKAKNAEQEKNAESHAGFENGERKKTPEEEKSEESDSEENLEEENNNAERSKTKSGEAENSENKDEKNDYRHKKELKKKQFDKMYDKEKSNLDGEEEPLEKIQNLFDQKISTQKEIIREEFSTIYEHEKHKYRGFLPGSYVRIVLENVPCEFVANYDTSQPIVMGGCLPLENNLTFLQVKLTKHRWHKRLLKSNDPLIFSIGWRRFQSLPVYCVEDANGRKRMVKYTPENQHCYAVFWGPVVPQGTGVFGFVGLKPEKNEFQIAVNGSVTELNQTFNIVKKLKLVGEPYKVEKNTAFIKNMFNSPLEAAKFEGAALRTVSGIRGAVKRALTNSEPGHFRATFEDKILLSDIVFLRCWVPVPLEKFFNPLMLQLNVKGSGQNALEAGLMRPTGRIRKEDNVSAEFKADSIYKPVVREDKVFAPLVIPRKLQKDLPFKTKPKVPTKPKEKTFQQKRPKIMSTVSNEVRQIMTKLDALKNTALEREEKNKAERLMKREKEMEKLEAVVKRKNRERRKMRYVKGKKK